jgi:hypothetical protein
MGDAPARVDIHDGKQIVPRIRSKSDPDQPLKKDSNKARDDGLRLVRIERQSRIVKPYTNAIAQRMFVSTGDRNYILARIAFFEGLDLDFFWLSLHALEKYYKAALLMNGHEAKSYGHDLLALHAAVVKVEPRRPIRQLVDPSIKGLRWRDETVEAYLKRLNTYGSAANRYATYGYCLSGARVNHRHA